MTAADLSPSDIVAIHQLLALYGHAADWPTQARLAEVFTEDAVFHSRVRNVRLVGLAAIQEWFALGKPPHPPAHQSTNVFVYTADETVRVMSKYIAIDHETGTARTGDYADIVVKTEAGWRIKERVSIARFGG
jgi:SnoaL-like domain